jgi:Domain of unknown function (DUF4386)
MAQFRLSTITGGSAVLTVACFVLGIVLMASSGVQVLIPDSGDEAAWMVDANDGGELFVAGAWIAVAAGLVGIVALVGLYDVLKSAGPYLVFAPALAIAGLTLVTISHFVPITIAQETAPVFVSGGPAVKAAALVDAKTLTSVAHLANYFGDMLLWSVVTPLYAYAILKTRLLPRWIGWVGMVAAVFAGWLGIFSPLSSLIDGLTFLGFVAFFVFLAAVGVAVLRQKEMPAASLAPA